MKRFCIFLFISLLSVKSYAQADENNKSSFFKIGTSYLNNFIYLGRPDSLLLPYLTANVEYHHASGLYASFSSSIMTNSSKPNIDYNSIDVGYEIKVNENLNGSVYGNWSSYNKSSLNPNSSIGKYVGGNFSYNLGVLELSASNDFMFSKKTDMATSVGVSHDFYLDEESQYYITPSLYTYFGTQHYYEYYTSRRLGRNTLKSYPNARSITSNTLLDNPGYKLMCMELSTIAGYEGEKILWFVQPTLAIPKNPIYTTTYTTITLMNGSKINLTRNSTPQSEIKLKNVFYFETGVSFKF